MRENMAMVKFMLILVLIVAGIYSLLLNAIAQVFFPIQAQGSLIYYQDKLLGSQLLGQEFHTLRYFHGRPSLTSYQSDIIQGQALKLSTTIKSSPVITPEMSVPSASMLDPHISWQAVLAQMPGVAKARAIPLQDLHLFIQQHGFQHGLVNVLQLNLALDQKWNSNEKTRS